ncbi:MAG: enoyl-CoA hydratase/isomerase family protein [Acidobacteria bacterium]|nr:enoyl-CoA hydratase/isomerase family protein [Acidobacteriota bacterium]
MSSTRFDLTNGVATITLDRPDKLNAFSGEMAAELQDAWARCDTDDDVRVVVLTGQGRAFCAGADFSDGASVFAAPTQTDDKPAFSADPFRFHAWDVRKPVIAAINGHAIGIGLTMTLQCDLRYVAQDAKLGIVQVRRGVMPDARAHWSLPRLIGHARAAEILLTGRMFSGVEAADWGLANEALPADAVLDRALDVARDIATNTAPVSVGVTKRLLWRDPEGRSEEIERLETELHHHLMAGPDAREGVVAFMEKRDPRWEMTLTDDWPDWLD